MRSPMHPQQSAIWPIVAAGLLLTVAGCGSQLPVVSGTVTLDGQPLANATVMFMPDEETESPAQGITDAQGSYTLEQEAETAGIQPGSYSVRITTFQPAAPNEDPPTPVVKEKVPVRYNLKSTLQAEVGQEQAVFDFVLTSDGPIFQPAADAF